MGRLPHELEGDAPSLGDPILVRAAEADPALGRAAHGLVHAQNAYQRTARLAQLAPGLAERSAGGIERGDLDLIPDGGQDRKIDDPALVRIEAGRGAVANRRPLQVLPHRGHDLERLRGRGGIGHADAEPHRLRRTRHMRLEPDVFDEDGGPRPAHQRDQPERSQRRGPGEHER